MYKRISTIILLLFFCQCFASGSIKSFCKDSTLRYQHSISVNVSRTLFLDYIGMYQYRLSKRIALGFEGGYSSNKTHFAEISFMDAAKFNWSGPDAIIYFKRYNRNKIHARNYESYFSLNFQYQYREIDYQHVWFWRRSEYGMNYVLTDSKWRKYGLNLLWGISGKKNKHLFYDFYCGLGLKYRDGYINFYNIGPEILHDTDTPGLNGYVPTFKAGFRIGFQF